MQYLNKVFIGISYGISFPLTLTILDYWLKDLGVSNTAIGLFSLIHWPFMFKFLWGAFIENYDIPFLPKNFGRYKNWLLCSYLLLIVGVLVMAFSSPETNIYYLMLGASVVSIADGCKNVVLYPYQLINSQPRSFGFVASCVSLGHRLGSIFIKVTILQIAHFWSWKYAYLFAAFTIFVILLITLFIQEPKQKNFTNDRISVKTAFMRSFFHPLSEFLRNREGLKIIGVICLFKSADFMIQKMSRIFCIEMGFSKLELANIVQFYGSITVILGSFITGYLMRKFGIKKSMQTALCLHGFSFIAYLLLIQYGNLNTVLVFIITLEALTGGAVTACFISFFYSVSPGAAMYSVLWALHELSGLVFMSLSGMAVNLLGWKFFFPSVALLIIPGLALVRKIEFSKPAFQN